jgi:hypothetical protein
MCRYAVVHEHAKLSTQAGCLVGHDSYRRFDDTGMSFHQMAIQQHVDQFDCLGNTRLCHRR